jgi:leader peptidase (prepilin peptidase)/N-methyltransferase
MRISNKPPQQKPRCLLAITHAEWECTLLMLALMEIDRLRCPLWLAGLLLALFATLPIAIPTLQPVEFTSQKSLDFSDALPKWVVRVLTCIIGGIVGFAIAALFRYLGSRYLRRHFLGHSFALSMILIGCTLGWQASITIAALTIVALFFLMALRHWSRIPKRVPATSLLFTVAMMHHPLWKWFAGFW